jgi:hypothetical protein
LSPQEQAAPAVLYDWLVIKVGEKVTVEKQARLDGV